MSRIKANSLSDIESIDSYEEETSKSEIVAISSEEEDEESSDEGKYSIADLNS